MSEPDAFDDMADLERESLVVAMTAMDRMTSFLFGDAMFDSVDGVISELESTAHWRDGVQRRYPNDDRNARAAKACRSLASDIKAIDRRDPLVRAIEVLARTSEKAQAWDDNNQFETFLMDWHESRSAFFRAIGFSAQYHTGRDFLMKYCKVLANHCADMVDTFTQDQAITDGPPPDA
jgi:hypothetical protein